jgi:cyclopropane-fatty-acyl-phospholipid synthase
MFSQTVVAVFSTVAMLLAWNWQKNHANAGVVDVVWAFGMMFAGPWYALTGTAPLLLKLSLGVLTFCWFWRLGRHLQRRVFRETEDGRYHAMRKAMKERADLGFLLFFLLQAGFIWLLSLPFWAVAQNTGPQTLCVVAALLSSEVTLNIAV